jgi:hypothetical protein
VFPQRFVFFYYVAYSYLSVFNSTKRHFTRENEYIVSRVSKRTQKRYTQLETTKNLNFIQYENSITRNINMLLQLNF